MVYPICVGCSSQIRQRQTFKVGEGLGKVFWSARLLSLVNSNDCICQKCRLKFVVWNKETSFDFTHLINNEEVKTEVDLDENDDDVRSSL